MDSEFQTLVFSRPPQEIDIMKNAAAQFARGEEQALLLVKVYFPDMPPAKAREFLKWLARHYGIAAPPKKK